MNTWKVIWNAFYSKASIRHVFAEIWRLSATSQLAIIGAASIAFVFALMIFLFADGQNGLAFFLAISSEMVLLYSFNSVKNEIFLSEFGLHETEMAPPDHENHRDNRYSFFRRELREKQITKAQVEDALTLVDAKLDLETSRGELPRKYFGFSVGLVSGTLISWSKNLEIQEISIAIIALMVVSFFAILILWMVPSRTERLRELKYFMHLYCRREVD